MRAVLQITKSAILHCEGEIKADCGRGMCILLGIEEADDRKKAELLADKILKMRIFADENGKLNLSCADIGADLLAISNFTLCADCSSRRPSFFRAMKFDRAKELYDDFLSILKKGAETLAKEKGNEVRVFPGVFGGDMQVEIVNDGPVTIVLDSKDFV
ncbi:MAG: D-tyrosyl-tRNA(Tyr) deacylase [Clostridia bacterium]|nr:D-tyrosyl-tRNA(Tyr) deacylase [Clostridia bacterium]